MDYRLRCIRFFRDLLFLHPIGQTLIVTAGLGRVQKWGGPIEEIRPGDVVWFKPNEKHWHGASATGAMTQIAIQRGAASFTLW